MKKGFTMIELIFVIVILGILAAVAIPRLAATRDDAQVAKALSNLGTAVSDITSNYTAQGEFVKDLTQFTNVEGLSYADATKTLDTLNDAAVVAGTVETVTLDYKVGKTNKCALVNVIKNDQSEISIFIGTSKVVTLQEDIVAKNSDLDAAKKLDDTDPEKANKIKAAEKAVDAAKKALQTALTKRGGMIPDGADSSCRSLVSASSFMEMAGKNYQLSGSRVRF